MSEQNRQPTIGYLAQVFPHLTMTFVYREVAALRAMGLPVQTFSTWKPSLDELSAEAKALVDSTFYIFPMNWLQLVISHLAYLLTRPGRYLGTLCFYLSREHKTFKNRLRTLLHFGQAVYLAREVEQRGIQHLHVHFALNATTIAMIIGRLSNISFSFTAHANDIFANPILLPEKIKAAKFIIAISQYNIDFLCRLVPSPEIRKKSHLVHCGIDVQHFAPVQKPDNNETPLILAVGRLVEKKGYPYLIKACNLLVQRGYRFRCLIIGGGPEQVTLQNMIDVHQLGDYVSLLGVVFQEDLKDRMAQADICVLPCVIAHDDDMDGIPNTLMEAMAMEIPVISTNISGIPELIDDHQSGLLVPAQDEQALAEAIATLFDQPELADRLGKAGREKVVAEFEIEKNARQVLSIFKQYLSNIRLPDRQVGPALVERRESLPSQDHL